MGGKVQSPLSKTARCIQHVISIVVYAQFSRWLWSFQREFGFNWNTLTMIISVFWTPLVSTPGPTIVNISYSFVIYGIMNLIIRDYYMVIICKSFSLFSGLKCVYLIVELASTFTLLPAPQPPNWVQISGLSYNRFVRIPLVQIKIRHILYVNINITSKSF